MKSDSKVYRLTGNKTPLTCMIATKHSRSKELLWLDKEKRENRALRYATNQTSIFLDEQDGQARLGHIVFIDGALVVNNRQITLQKFLEHHPDNVSNGGGVFYEMDHKAQAKNEVQSLDLAFEAQKIARELTMSQIEAIIRQINPSQVDKMYAEEMKRDIRVFAKQNPSLFLSMIEDPEIEVENVVSNILDAGLIQFRKRNTEVWYNMPDNKKLLFRIPEGEDHMSSLNRYLTDDNEGIKKYNALMEALEGDM